MMKRNELSNAIALALAASTSLVSGALIADENVLEEVTVTATKRAENLLYRGLAEVRECLVAKGWKP